MKTRALLHLTGSLGDTLVAIPALRVVRACLPEAELIVLHSAPEPGRVAPQSLLKPGELVDGFVSYEHAAGLGARLALLRRVRALRARTVVSLAYAERPAAALRRDRLFFRLCGARRLVGFRPIAEGELLRRGPEGALAPTRHEAEWRLERLRRSGWDVEPLSASAWRLPLVACEAAERETVAAWLRARGAGARPLLAFAPGTPMPAKRWPLERFAELGRRLAAGESALPVVVGGPEDAAAGERLVSAWGSGLNAAGAFAPRESAALLERCRLLVGVDSGPAHLAAAVGCRTVVISSAHRPAGQWAPLGPGHTVLRRDVPCAGCRLAACPLTDHPCLSGIEVEDVLAAVQAAWRSIEATPPAVAPAR